MPGAIMPAMEKARLKVSERMRAMTSYDKFAGPEPRVLILQSRFGMDGGCANAARALGWPVQRIPVSKGGELSDEAAARLLHDLASFKPDFILTANLSGMDPQGVYAALFEQLEIPFATWFIDNPRTLYADLDPFAHEYAAAFTWDEAYVPYFSAMGYPLIRVLPLATDPTLFDGLPADVPDFPGGFVGSSMLARTTEHRDWLEGRPALAEAIQDAFDAGSVTRENFGKGLDTILDAELVRAMDVEERWHVEVYIFMEGTRRLREDFAKAMAPEGVTFHGDDGWKAWVPATAPTMDYERALPGFYQRCEVNLDITSIQMPTTVTQRVFDCPAAGGFLLTDGQPALAQLFDVDTEVAQYTSLEECIELFRWYRAHPAARRKLVTKARRRVHGEHLYKHRLQTMAACLKDHFGS